MMAIQSRLNRLQSLQARRGRTFVKSIGLVLAVGLDLLAMTRVLFEGMSTMDEEEGDSKTGTHNRT